MNCQKHNVDEAIVSFVMNNQKKFYPANASSEIYTVWIGTSEKIASFHYVADYEDHSFLCHDHFLHFLCSLQEQGYRFQ